ncbi:hypothetical protein DERP_006545 [Dermatophagoides pteronyssinus]|uniref:Uncharacterized protein n=1 Tax=Dermatophagoides pteronyssinus TaxID=6956 RepID=A0ABQ8IQH5_DERPT|nr:hypothetical protein DERP_006545 [Dermatophagoides pteronyssinus]
MLNPNLSITNLLINYFNQIFMINNHEDNICQFSGMNHHNHQRQQSQIDVNCPLIVVDYHHMKIENLCFVDHS